MSQMLIPKAITGGCLCGGVRYQIDFAHDHDWKAGPHTCQCTQCRKNTGCLVYDFHSVTTEELTWVSKSTYAEFNSSPGCYRAFCKNCGSTLCWTDHKLNTIVELAVGTFDEEFLVGVRDTEEGEPHGGYGMALANPAGDHFFIRNQIPGVTDKVSVSGTKFWKDSKDGPMAGTK